MPSEAETLEIRWVLCDRIDRLAALMGISTLNGNHSISSRREARDNLHAEVGVLRALLSPSRKLAPELVARIFIYCVPVQELRESAFRANEAPLLVAQICRGWRQVALSTPHLWTRMAICLPLGRLPPPAWTTAITNAASTYLTWISRSGGHKLHIAIQHVPSVDSNNSYRFSQVWRPAATDLVSTLVRHHGSRIETLSLSLPVPCASSLLHANCPSLKNLSIIDDGLCGPRESQESVQAIPTGIHLAGQLRVLILDTPPLDLQMVHYPWDQLTVLRFGPDFCVSLPDAFALLRICQRLETFIISIDPAEGIVVYEALVAPALRELRVYEGPDPDDSGAFFGAISAPNLEELVIGQEYHQGSLLDFVGKLSQPLLSLRFYNTWNWGVTENDLCAVLELIPSLVELSTVIPCHGSLFDALLPGYGHAPLCPRLESLAIRVHSLANDKLVRLLDARCRSAFRDNGITQLKKIRIAFVDLAPRAESWVWNDAAWMQKVDQWRREGIDLDVQDSNLYKRGGGFAGQFEEDNWD